MTEERNIFISCFDGQDPRKNMIYIKYLPKDRLLYMLWENAKIAQYFFEYPTTTPPVLTICKARRDINYMIMNNRALDLTTYYGRLVFSDLSGDYYDYFTYELYNGSGSARYIVQQLKMDEMKKAILRYYVS
jgi:hypothetical protein